MNREEILNMIVNHRNVDRIKFIDRAPTGSIYVGVEHDKKYDTHFRIADHPSKYEIDDYFQIAIDYAHRRNSFRFSSKFWEESKEDFKKYLDKVL